MTTRRYLLVDDNREFAENMAEILTDEGADVTRAVDGPSALSALDHGPFDVMITDMRMPGVTGAELLKLVRVRDPGLPVVVVSAYTRDEQLEEAHRLGLLAFMLKTASPAKLLELLERARRDAVVLAVCDDEARIERAREALAMVGITVCTVRGAGDLEGHPEPMAAIIENFTSPLAGALRLRFPNTMLVKCCDALSLPGQLATRN